MISSLLVTSLTGAAAGFNDIWTYRGEYHGRPFWNKQDRATDPNRVAVHWLSAQQDWVMRNAVGLPSYTGPSLSSDFPWEVAWNFGLGPYPPPIILEIPEPTYNLPLETIVLVTNIHGSVANYLRLRNQGQI